MAKSFNFKNLMERYKAGDFSGGPVNRTMAVGIGEEGGGRPPDYNRITTTAVGENGGGIGGDPSQLKTTAVGERGGGAWGPLNPQTKPTPRRKDSKYGNRSPFFKGNPPPPPSMRTPPVSQQKPGADNPRRPTPKFAPPKAPPGGQQSMTMAIPEGGGGQPGPIQSQGPGTGLSPDHLRAQTLAVGENGGGHPLFRSQGPGTGLAPGARDEIAFGGPVQSRENDALNKQIKLQQLMQPPRDRSQIIEDRAREQVLIDSPPGSPQRKHLEAGGKVTDMPKPDGTPQKDVQPGGYPVGGPTRDGSPGFLEPDPKNPHGSKQAEVKHNIEIERQKEAELGNKATDKTMGLNTSTGKQESKPSPTTDQKPTASTPDIYAERKQVPTETDTPAPVKTEQPILIDDTAPTDTRTTPQQRDAAQKFKDKRQERITGKKSMPFG